MHPPTHHQHNPKHPVPASKQVCSLSQNVGALFLFNSSFFVYLCRRACMKQCVKENNAIRLFCGCSGLLGEKNTHTHVHHTCMQVKGAFLVDERPVVLFFDKNLWVEGADQYEHFSVWTLLSVYLLTNRSRIDRALLLRVLKLPFSKRLIKKLIFTSILDLYRITMCLQKLVVAHDSHLHTQECFRFILRSRRHGDTTVRPRSKQHDG